MTVAPRTGVISVALVVLLMGACGDGSGGADGVATLEGSSDAAATTVASPDGEGGSADLEEALLAFTACMREEGFDLPDPEVDAEGNLRLVSFLADAGLEAVRRDAERLREAAQGCRHHLEGVALRFASLDQTAMQDRLLEYAACMREHGFDMPDPDFSGGPPGSGRGPFPGLRLDVLQDPGFREANESCQGIFAGLVPQADGAPEGG